MAYQSTTTQALSKIKTELTALNAKLAKVLDVLNMLPADANAAYCELRELAVKIQSEIAEREEDREYLEEMAKLDRRYQKQVKEFAAFDAGVEAYRSAEENGWTLTCEYKTKFEIKAWQKGVASMIKKYGHVGTDYRYPNAA